jgi:hypothetical protein
MNGIFIPKIDEAQTKHVQLKNRKNGIYVGTRAQYSIPDASHGSISKQRFVRHFLSSTLHSAQRKISRPLAGANSHGL